MSLTYVPQWTILKIISHVLILYFWSWDCHALLLSWMLTSPKYLHACHSSLQWLVPVSHPRIAPFVSCFFPAISLPSGHTLDFSQVETIYLCIKAFSPQPPSLEVSWVLNINFLETFHMSTHFWTIPMYLPLKSTSILFIFDSHRPHLLLRHMDLSTFTTVFGLLVLVVCCPPKEQEFVFNICLCTYLYQTECLTYVHTKKYNFKNRSNLICFLQFVGFLFLFLLTCSGQSFRTLLRRNEKGEYVWVVPNSKGNFPGFHFWKWI